MNRSNYSEDCYGWELIRWRGAVKKAIEGKRGQAFLKELLKTLDELPEKKLIKGQLATTHGEVCAIGSVMKNRGINTDGVDVYDSTYIAQVLGISDALVREIEYCNDEAWAWGEGITAEKRFQIVRDWVKDHIKEENNG